MSEPGLLALLREIARGHDPRAGRFARGLAIGALVGAMIAGSTIWGRHRRGR